MGCDRVGAYVGDRVGDYERGYVRSCLFLPLSVFQVTISTTTYVRTYITYI